MGLPIANKDHRHPLNRQCASNPRSQFSPIRSVNQFCEMGTLTTNEFQELFSMNNRVSASLEANDRAEVIAALQTIKDKLPFLLSLTADERKALAKMGDRNLPFVKKALEVATQNPDFLPRTFDLEELRKDVELFEAMYPLMIAFSQIQVSLNDTYMTVGSEAYTAALKVYNYAKANGDDAGMEPLVDELAQRFNRKTKKSSSEAPSD